MTRWLVASGISALLLAGTARSQEAAVLTIKPAPAPVLDGRIGEEEWAEAARFVVGTRGESMADGFVMRSGRQLLIALRCRIGPNSVGLRLTFPDPDIRREVSALVAPLNPPHPPLTLFRTSPEEAPERLDVSRCDVRFHFDESTRGFEAELRLPLDLLGFDRSNRRRPFRAGLWALGPNRAIAGFPVSVGTSPMMRRGFAGLRPSDNWGLDVEPGAEKFEEQAALRLLDRIEAERAAPPDVETEPVLLAYLGIRDGRRQDAPLAALETRLRELIERYPDYFALREVLVRVLTGRNLLEEALAETARAEKDFPALERSVTQLLLRSQILRDLGRYRDAMAELDRNPKLGELFPELAGIQIGLSRLARARDLEERMRTEDAARDDCPRVRLVTSKGPILLELFEDEAPNAVANFIALVESGFYDGTRFHWVERAGQAIGGDPLSRDDDPSNDGLGDPGYLLESDPGRRMHLPFTIAYVDQRGRLRTEGCAFSLRISAAPELNGRSTVFGRVIEGRETVLRLEYYDVIESASVVRKRDHDYVPVKRAKPAE
jgi:cyclophilin family peptidyl-prolyl cis-trans isomerase